MTSRSDQGTMTASGLENCASLRGEARRMAQVSPNTWSKDNDLESAVRKFKVSRLVLRVRQKQVELLSTRCLAPCSRAKIRNPWRRWCTAICRTRRGPGPCFGGSRTAQSASCTATWELRHCSKSTSQALQGRHHSVRRIKTAGPVDVQHSNDSSVTASSLVQYIPDGVRQAALPARNIRQLLFDSLDTCVATPAQVRPDHALCGRQRRRCVLTKPLQCLQLVVPVSQVSEQAHTLQAEHLRCTRCSAGTLASRPLVKSKPPILHCKNIGHHESSPSASRNLWELALLSEQCSIDQVPTARLVLLLGRF